MTDQEINIAIAEACGAKWVAYGHLKSDICWLTPGWKIPACIKTGGHIASLDDHNAGVLSEDIPDYCNDLNAMNEAEQTIVDWICYRIQLSLVVGIGYAPDLEINDDIKAFVSAKASQRAEAFLKCKGLWRKAIVEGGK